MNGWPFFSTIFIFAFFLSITKGQEIEHFENIDDSSVLEKIYVFNIDDNSVFVGNFDKSYIYSYNKRGFSISAQDYEEIGKDNYCNKDEVKCPLLITKDNKPSAFVAFKKALYSEDKYDLSVVRYGIDSKVYDDIYRQPSFLMVLNETAIIYRFSSPSAQTGTDRYFDYALNIETHIRDCKETGTEVVGFYYDKDEDVLAYLESNKAVLSIKLYQPSSNFFKGKSNNSIDKNIGFSFSSYIDALKLSKGKVCACGLSSDTLTCVVVGYDASSPTLSFSLSHQIITTDSTKCEGRFVMKASSGGNMIILGCGKSKFSVTIVKYREQGNSGIITTTCLGSLKDLNYVFVDVAIVNGGYFVLAIVEKAAQRAENSFKYLVYSDCKDFTVSYKANTPTNLRTDFSLHMGVSNKIMLIRKAEGVQVSDSNNKFKEVELNQPYDLGDLFFNSPKSIEVSLVYTPYFQYLESQLNTTCTAKLISCYGTCETCTKKGDDTNHNCLACRTGYSLNSGNCITGNGCEEYEYEGSEKLCKKCKNGFIKFSDNFPEKKAADCKEREDKKEGYFLYKHDDEEDWYYKCSTDQCKYCEYQNPSTDKARIISSEGSDICSECKNEMELFQESNDSPKRICITDSQIKEKGNLYRDEDGVYKNCHNACKTCEKGGNDKQNNCSTCPDGKDPKNGNCRDPQGGEEEEEKEGKYKDTDGTYKDCYSTCKKCKTGGDRNKNNCEACKDSYFLIWKEESYKNCIKKEKIPKSYTLNETSGEVVACSEGCKDCEIKENVMKCQKCKEEFEITKEKTCKSQSKVSEDDIESFLPLDKEERFNGERIIELPGNKSLLYFTPSASITPTNITYISIRDCEQKIMDAKGTNQVIVAQVLDKNDIFKLDYKVYNAKGEEIEIKDVCDSVNIYYPMVRNYTSSNLVNRIVTSKRIEGKVDLYDPTSEFYSSECSLFYVDEEEITVEQRRAMYQYELTFCPVGCENQGYSKMSQTLQCSCPLSKEITNVTSPEKTFLDKNTMSIKSMLKCSKLIKQFPSSISLIHWVPLCTIPLYAFLTYFFIAHSVEKMTFKLKTLIKEVKSSSNPPKRLSLQDEAEDDEKGIEMYELPDDIAFGATISLDKVQSSERKESNSRKQNNSPSYTALEEELSECTSFEKALKGDKNVKNYFQSLISEKLFIISIVLHKKGFLYQTSVRISLYLCILSLYVFFISFFTSDVESDEKNVLQTFWDDVVEVMYSFGIVYALYKVVEYYLRNYRLCCGRVKESELTSEYTRWLILRVKVRTSIVMVGLYVVTMFVWYYLYIFGFIKRKRQGPVMFETFGLFVLTLIFQIFISSVCAIFWSMSLVMKSSFIFIVSKLFYYLI